MRKLLGWLLQKLVACNHIKMSRPFHDEDGDYQRCTDCGTRIQSKIQFDNRKPPWGKLPKLPTQAVVDNYLSTLETETKQKK